MADKFDDDKEFANRLKIAADRQMTAVEIYNQTVSYIFGNLPGDSGITKERVASLVRKNSGVAAD